MQASNVLAIVLMTATTASVSGCCCPIGRFMDRGGSSSSSRDPLPIEAQAIYRPATQDVEVAVQTTPGASVTVRASGSSYRTLASGVAVGGNWKRTVNADDAPAGTWMLTVRATQGIRSGTKTLPVTLPPGFASRTQGNLQCRRTPVPCDIRWERGGRDTFGGPPGTTLAMGGVQGVAPAVGRGTLAAGPEVLLASADISWLSATGVRGSPETELPVVLTLPGTAPITGTMKLSALSVKDALRAIFERARSGPVPVPVEGQGRAIAVLSGVTIEMVGPLRTLGDVSRVAFYETRTRTGSCGSYGGGGTVRRLEKRMYDRHYRVFDRRTGQQVVQRTFTAPTPRCPDRISAGSSGVSGFADLGQIRQWLESL